MKLIFYILIIMTNIISLKAQNPDFIFMVEQATKAPSGHNTQPWLFKINTADIEIHPNLEKRLAIVDPDNRELFISLGCATENLCIAASFKGYNTKVSIVDNQFINIQLLKDPSCKTDPLFNQISKRQSNRSVYNEKNIPADNINRLKNIDMEVGTNIHFYDNGTPYFDTIHDYIMKGNIMQMENEEFRNELISWMRFNKNHQNETNDGLSYAVFGAPNLPQFIVKPIISNSVNAKTQNKGDSKKIKSSSNLVLFSIQNNTLEEWVNLGRNLERFLLKTTEMGIASAFLNQVNELPELTKEMAKSINLKNEQSTIILRVGYSKNMPYSKRKSIEEVLL